MRLFDLRFNAVGVAAAKALTDATDLIIVTPTDTKTFHIGKGPATPSTPAPVRTAAPGARPAPKRALPPGVDAETARLIEEGDAEAEASGVELEEEEEAGEEGLEPEPMDEVLRLAAEAGDQVQPRRQPAPGNAPCGRCGGAGEINTPLEGGGFVKGTCPVCQGHGRIQRYGSSPSRRGR